MLRKPKTKKFSVLGFVKMVLRESFRWVEFLSFSTSWMLSLSRIAWSFVLLHAFLNIPLWFCREMSWHEVSCIVCGVWYFNQGKRILSTSCQDIKKTYVHWRNTPSARVPSLTALIVGSLHLFTQFLTPARVLLSRGLSGGSSKPSTYCSQQPLKPPLINCN